MDLFFVFFFNRNAKRQKTSSCKVLPPALLINPAKIAAKTTGRSFSNFAGNKKPDLEARNKSLTGRKNLPLIHHMRGPCACTKCQM